MHKKKAECEIVAPSRDLADLQDDEPADFGPDHRIN